MYLFHVLKQLCTCDQQSSTGKYSVYLVLSVNMWVYIALFPSNQEKKTRRFRALRSGWEGVQKLKNSKVFLSLQVPLFHALLSPDTCLVQFQASTLTASQIFVILLTISIAKFKGGQPQTRPLPDAANSLLHCLLSLHLLGIKYNVCSRTGQ